MPVSQVFGGYYTDANLDKTVSLVPGREISVINGLQVTTVPLPPNDEPLFLVLSPDGRAMAGQGHNTPHTWEYTDGAWRSKQTACGTFPVIYDHNNVLHISDCSIGSQGWRYVSPSGQLITGDQTVSVRNGLNEWTDLSDAQDGSLMIGQGNAAGGVGVWIDGHLRLLHGGACYDIRARRYGSLCVISFYEVQHDGLCAFVYRYTLDELRALQAYPSTTVPSNPDPITLPTNPPETPKMPVAPNKLSVVQQVMAEHPEINTKVDGERGKITDLVVIKLGGKPWGRKDRDKDPNNNNNSDDALCFLLPDGSFEIYDIIDGGSGGASWSYAGTFRDGENGYFREVAGVTPVDPPANPPTDTSSSMFTLVPSPSYIKKLEARLAAVEAKLAGIEDAIDDDGGFSLDDLDGLAFNIETDNGHYFSADGGGGGDVHSRRPLEGQPVEGYKPQGWETFKFRIKK